MTGTSKTIRAGVGAGLLALIAIACGGGGTGPTPPGGGGTGGGGTGGGGTGGGGTGGGGGGTVQTTTITINASGQVTPNDITVTQGSRVTMINNHNTNHEMASDQHPDHFDCPELNQWGFLTPGQSRQSGNLNTVRTCGYHDHNMSSNTALMGVIRITAQ